ncbi:disease resistance protein RPV1-like [Humulus lupulus]|uniref:disease resistance protein RPV1-like n=1 Tax=Humulus lupulus TaxID=3486 RepID=UPI002B412FC0|nr:disease resistance protein RPV1-like [Humulus lupulus]
MNNLDDQPQTPAPSSISLGKRHDVFIRFRGEDTRSNFTSHLNNALKKNGIETYIDDRLVRGEEISKALMDAIDQSKFCVIVFSRNYASSRWCFDELVHIHKCMDKKNLIALPVFYHVDPSDVRRQKRSYEAEFLKNENLFHEDKIKEWRVALTNVVNHSGWDTSNTRNDAELVDDIVNFIRGKLRPTSSTYLIEQGLVGMEESTKDLNKLSSNAPIVGICGMGGLGKTTLADVIFKQSHPQFDGHSFLRNVREERQKYGLACLRKRLFCKLSNEKDIDEDDLDAVKKKLNHKKLLIILDDVDDLEDYESLLQDSHNWLDSKSKVIITSRNLQVLRNIIGDDEKIHKLKILNEKEALELFSLHAFKTKSVEESYKELSIKVVNYAQGFPLALKVLGSHLYLKSKQVWQSVLSKMKVDPNQTIINKLKISFNGLDGKEKNIFLDIACFFRGYSKDYVAEILDTCGSFAAVIEVLIDKCLITLSWDRLIQMHDLLQEMGWSIARGSHYNHLGDYSRLWIAEDIYNLLRTNKGTATIEGIFSVDDGQLYGKKLEGVNLNPLVFMNMPYLKLLKMPNHCVNGLQFPQGLHDYFPDELRYLEWYKCPLKSLGSHFTPHNLVYLKMVNSQLGKLWNEFQDVGNLKYVILSHSKNLTCLPDLSRANLHKICLQDCTNLVELPPLRFHNVLDYGEKEWEAINRYKNFILSLIYDDDDDDDGFGGYYEYSDGDDDSFGGYYEYSDGDDNSFGEDLDDDYGGGYLDDDDDDDDGLGGYYEDFDGDDDDDSFGGYYESFDDDCETFEWFNTRTDLSEMSNNDEDYDCLVNLRQCSKLKTLSEMSGNIKFICLRSTAIEELHSSIVFLNNLLVLDLRDCKYLKSLPKDISKLESLEYLDMGECALIDKFPELPKNLKGLDLSGTSIRKVDSSSFECLPCLNILYMKDCTNLESLPTSIWKLKSLFGLSFEHCSQLKRFPKILNTVKKLKELNLIGTGIREAPSPIENLIALKKLNLSKCKRLEFISTGICRLKFLSELNLSNCPRLRVHEQILEFTKNLSKFEHKD